MHLIKNERVLCKDKIIKKGGHIAKIGDIIDIHLESNSAKNEPLKIDFDCEIIYEDEDFMIINKPYNLTTHKAKSEKNPTLQEWLTYKGKTLSTIYGEEREGIVHRLDKPTSGAIVVAKNNEAHLNLSKQLQNKSMGRYYLGIIDKSIKDDILVDRALGRLRNNRIKFSVNTSLKKREAMSMFCKVATDFEENKELIVIKLITGRTHQIRAHLESMNRHLIGDTMYGYSGDMVLDHRIFLHAYLLFLIHPRTGEKMTFRASLHDDMSLFLDNNFDKREVNEKIETDRIIDSFDAYNKRMYSINTKWKKS